MDYPTIDEMKLAWIDFAEFHHPHQKDARTLMLNDANLFRVFCAGYHMGSQRKVE